MCYAFLILKYIKNSPFHYSDREGRWTEAETDTPCGRILSGKVFVFSLVFTHRCRWINYEHNLIKAKLGKKMLTNVAESILLIFYYPSNRILFMFIVYALIVLMSLSITFLRYFLVSRTAVHCCSLLLHSSLRRHQYIFFSLLFRL